MARLVTQDELETTKESLVNLRNAALDAGDMNRATILTQAVSILSQLLEVVSLDK